MGRANLGITLGGNQTWKNGSASLLSVNGNVINSGWTISITSSGSNGPMSISGDISGGGGITVTANTRLVLSGDNTFTGALAVQGSGTGGSGVGTIAFDSIADFGAASALGAAASGSISLGNGSVSSGRLEYIGSTNMESNRTITIAGTATNAGQIFNNGTGTLTFDATNFNTTAGGARSLLLSGSNTGDNAIKGIISNAGGTLSLNKTGLGTWILGGANSYTGATAITGGLLRFDGVATAASNVAISAGAAMGGGGTVLGTVTAAVGTATTNGSGTNTISAKVGLGVSQTWTVATGGTLTVTGGVNDFGSGFSLTKAGGGDLNISGALNYSGDTTISGGTLKSRSTAAEDWS